MNNMSKEEFVHVLRRRSTGFSRGSSKYRGVTLHKCGRWEARMGQFLGKKWGALKLKTVTTSYICYINLAWEMGLNSRTQFYATSCCHFVGNVVSWLTLVLRASPPDSHLFCHHHNLTYILSKWVIFVDAKKWQCCFSHFIEAINLHWTMKRV